MEPGRMKRSSEPMTMTPTSVASPTVPKEVVDHLIHANFWDPFSILGVHEVEREGKPALAVRAFLPYARQAWVVPVEKGGPGARISLHRIHPDGLFEVILPDRVEPFRYRLAVENHDGHSWEFEDPYRF